jgi:serralysin
VAITSWNGAAGNYTDPTQWSAGAVPSSGDTAIINSGTVNASNVTFTNLALDLNANGSAAGALTLNGDTIDPASALTVNDQNAFGVMPFPVLNFQGTTTNNGVVTFLGTVTSLQFASGAALVNNGLLNLVDASPTFIPASGAPLPTIQNNGTIQVSDADKAFQAAIVDGDITGSGTISIGAGGKLDLSGAVGAGQNLLFSGGARASYLVQLDSVGAFSATVSGFDADDTLVITNIPFTGYNYVPASASSGTLILLNGSTALGSVKFAGPYSNALFSFVYNQFGAGLSNLTITTAVVPPSLPDVSPYFTPAVDALLQSAIAALTPSSGILNVQSVAAGGSVAPSVPGALNAVVVTTGGAGASSAVPADYPLAYQFGGAATLQDSNGGTELIGTVANATLIGAAGDTLFGGNAGETLVAETGAETVYGGTGNNVIQLGAATAQAFTQGTDIVFGSSQAATVTSAGNTTLFGGSGSTVFDVTAGSATIVGGTGAETINANAAPMLVFGATGPFVYNAGSGAATVVSGVGSHATIAGGSTGLLYFGNGPTTYTPGTATDTILGYTGSLTATGGANGTLFFTGTAGDNVVSTGAGASTIYGFGAGDSLSATGSASDIVAATADSDTIDGTGSSGSNSYFAFGQNDVVEAGSGPTAIQSGLGNQTLVGGSGATLFDILGGVSRTLVVQNFVAGQDFVKLDGYGSGAAAAALATASFAGGGTTIALIDGTHVTFQGVTALTASSFV